ncbi:hypothetical protein GDO86_016816 [Hymenochirus boettgeri]|uniref:APC membrane recruitment protein 1 n=1 Tax=Hymenochirus boettgeri TaxID=247094 RepID=A0A8T2IQ91_9PIPI|nr:hypothetical protein GDO86_016816 [Hymenochirus boettgeri]
MESGQSCQENYPRTKPTYPSLCKKPKVISYVVDSEKVEVCEESVTCLKAQSPGKPKKSPFKFFGGRKSICTLPSFFGGKHKSIGKGNVRKGLSKSKTHDCISDVQVEDGKRFISDNSNVNIHGLELSNIRNCLSSSHSAGLNISSPDKPDFTFPDSSPVGSTECFEKKINGDKSLSLPRPKKGLMGLFNSIRRHKKIKTPDVEKPEQYTNVSPCVIRAIIDKNEEEELKVGEEQPKIECSPSELSQEPLLDRNAEQEQTLECLSGAAPPLCVDIPEESDQLGSLNPNHSLDSQTDLATAYLNPVGVLSEDTNADDLDQPTLPSGDQISLILEDVSSLKSFDSFTGCGDIIADQDVDTVSENAISLDQSRETTKRSSCLVTYQGGGEEMATPDDMEEEYLQQLLEETNEAEGCYDLKNENETYKIAKDMGHLDHTAYSLCTQVSNIDNVNKDNTELLTPQSDQQESAPNSDEGYYDSTTPGPDDDAGEDLSHKERLPRDSYSGDALYEFYEQDDSLMSPLPGGESLYERKTPGSDIFEQFFNFDLPTENGLIQGHRHKECGTETEEERLAVIQKQLLFWERQRVAAVKGMQHKETFSKEKQNIDLENTAERFCNRHQSVSKVSIVAENVESEKQRLKDLQETSCRDSYCKDSFFENQEGNSLINASFELNVPCLGTQDISDKTININTFSSPKPNPIHHKQNVFVTDEDYDQDYKCEPAVNFSQTLAKFSNNSTLFSSISERLGKAGSSGSFHHNLDSLPTMVTFDVVDFENEGECEQQIDLSPDEEVVESFETFDHSCVQESLADCEQLFQTDLPNPLKSNWGVTSLPRHFGHYRFNSSMSEPLLVHRRSRSLDTEHLEIELGDLCLSKSGLKSYDFLDPWEGGKNSWRPENKCFQEYEGEWGGSTFLEQNIESRKAKSSTTISSSEQSYNRVIIPNKQLLQDGRQMAKPDLPLQCNTRQSQEVFNMVGHSTKKLALVLPLKDRRELGVHQSSGKPIGITQAMPQQNRNKDGTIKPPEDYQEQCESSKTEALEQEFASMNWSKNYTECTGS